MTDHLDLRESQLRSQIEQQERILQALPDDETFSTSVVRNQTVALVQDLRAELEELRDERLVVRLRDETRDRLAIDTALLGQILTRFQSALTYIGWALFSGPGIEGNPPATLARRTSTEVVAFAPGSFKIAMRKAHLQLPFATAPASDGTSQLLEQSVETLFALLSAAAEGEYPEELEELAEQLGAEPARRLALLFKKLAAKALTTEVTWSLAPDRHTIVRPNQARMLASWLESVEERLGEVVIRGVLRSADDVRGRFGLQDEDEALYEGKAAPELLLHKEIGASYNARIQVAKSVGERTKVERQRFVLLSLDRVEESS
jgi:hypothetical protein